MSQWPKFQDYGNSGIEAKESVVDGDWSSEEKNAEPLKTVRCVIDKDFELRRLGSGDAGPTQTTANARRESSKLICTERVDSVRLKNHLEWKKQKEMEYLRKREAERLDEERKKNEKIREEREKRRREKEREEKIREWQEQKAREKEERKREEMVMKALEQEIKGVTQTLDKEKLIHEWIRLKNKQQQMEARKKAELMKREEEARALRQSLAEISYRQWKEKTKNKRIALPKNGYQIFGPKPAPVVKEDWNHDFVKGDTDDRGMTARTPKSTVSMTSIRGPAVPRIDLSNEDLRKRSPSSCQLKIARSRTTVNDFNGRRSEMTLRISDSEERWKDNFITRHDDTTRRIFPGKAKGDAIGQQCSKMLPNGFTSKVKLFNMETLPTKSKLDIYLQPPGSDTTLESAAEEKPKKLKKPEDTLKKYLQGLSDVNSKLLVNLNEKLSLNQIRPTCSRNSVPDRRISRERNGEKRQSTPGQQGRRSRSYDKPIRKTSANRSSSLSATETSIKGEEAKKAKKLQQRNPKPEGKEKRKPKKPFKPEVTDSPYFTKKKSKSKCGKE